MGSDAVAIARKPEFLSRLHVDILNDDLALLLDDFTFYSAILEREVTVPKGEPTDFASVPRWPGAYWLTGGKARWEAVAHDYLCRHPEICDRATTDRVFVELMGVAFEIRIEGEYAAEMIKKLNAAKLYDAMRVDADGSVVVFKTAQRVWRRNVMGAGVRVGASWDAFKRGLRDDEARQEVP